MLRESMATAIRVYLRSLVVLVCNALLYQKPGLQRALFFGQVLVQEFANGTVGFDLVLLLREAVAFT